MTDTFGDDGWDELTRELGVEKAPPAPEPAEEDPASGYENAEAAPEGEEFDAGLEPEGDAPDGAEAPGEEQPGTGKKRRRRRRRGKKGAEEGGEPAEGSAPAEPAPARVAAEAEYDENEYDTGPGSESDELVPAGAGVEEDTAGEVLRELIANWNVPSWDSIITGLGRPER